MAKTVKLAEVAEVIRSKNSGPYELTLDIIFKDWETYRRVKTLGVFNPALIARLYRVGVDQVLSVIHFDPAKAVKATIVRPRPSGAVGETDVYGAQQHAPLLEFEFPLD
ncbi:MAG: DUF4387 domain-containing protein [Betaproteobacteria bacterium]